MEKVGSSSYYWSFESQVQNSLLKQKSRIENSLNETLAELEPLEQKLKLYEEDTEEIDEQKVTGQPILMSHKNDSFKWVNSKIKIPIILVIIF